MTHLELARLIIGIVLGLIGLACLGYGIYVIRHYSKVHSKEKFLDGKGWIGIGIVILLLMIVVVVPRH